MRTADLNDVILFELCDVLTRVSSLLNDPALPLALLTGVFFGAVTKEVISNLVRIFPDGNFCVDSIRDRIKVIEYLIKKIQYRIENYSFSASEKNYDF